MTNVALRLEVRRVGTADFRTFVPIEAQPLEAVQDWRERGLDVALLVGVVDAQEVVARVAAREQPVEEGRAHATDVEVAGGAWGEAGSGRRRGCHVILTLILH